MKSKATAIVLGLIGSQLFACADSAGRVRQHTYPPGFHYINSEQLRSTMWRLAYHSREIRELMKSPEEAAMHRAELLRELG